MSIQLGSITVTAGTKTPTRMALLLWGPSGVGKTTFAATSPGKKLWLSFGDNEHIPVMHRKDVSIGDLSSLSFEELFKHAQSDNPFGLDKILAENEDIQTVVCDSLTAVTYRALQKAVGEKAGAGRGFTPTMEAPGIAAYGARNAIVLEVVTGLLRVTSKHNVHCILTAHEADPTMRKDGAQDVIDYISMQLGGQLVNNMTWRLSEIWHLRQSDTGGKERVLSIRPSRLRRPMKSRMFTGMGNAEFALHYNADLPDAKQMTIANWHEQWVKGACQKLPTPK
jgi:hypothetical protein